MTSLTLLLADGHPDFEQIYSTAVGRTVEVIGVKSLKHRYNNVYVEFVSDEALEQAFLQCGWVKENSIDEVGNKPVVMLKARLVPGSDELDDAVYLHCQIDGTHLFFPQWSLILQ